MRQPAPHDGGLPPPPSAAYLPAMDGLRAVSIAIVVLSHLGLDHVVPGAFGVTLFFFISGYLITRQLAGALAAAGRIDFRCFYLRRALRLMPAGLVYIAVAGLVFRAAGGAITPWGWAAALLYGANYYDLWAGFRSTLAGVRHPFNILWSLAVEEHFYLVWPAVLALLRRRRRALVFVAVLCVAVLLWRGWLLHACFAASAAPGYCAPPNPNPLWRYNRLYLPTDTRLDSIAWGALLALLENGAALARLPVAGAGLAVLALSFMLPGALGRHVVRGTLQGAALLGLFPWLLWRPSWVRAWLSAPPALWLGQISYSLYLWHWAALGVADYWQPAHGWAWRAMAVPLALALACASYYGIERPMLGVRRRFGAQVKER